MKHRVIWTADAISYLSSCYLLAEADGRRNDVMKASHTASQRLMADPIGCSESRTERSRIVVELPLSVYFVIDENEPIVHIDQVFYCPPLKRS